MLALGVLALLLCLAHALASPWEALFSTGEGVVLVAEPSTADPEIQDWIRRDLMRDLGRDGIALLTPEDHAALSAVRPDAALSKPTVKARSQLFIAPWTLSYTIQEVRLNRRMVGTQVVREIGCTLLIEIYGRNGLLARSTRDQRTFEVREPRFQMHLRKPLGVSLTAGLVG